LYLYFTGAYVDWYCELRICTVWTTWKSSRKFT